MRTVRTEEQLAKQLAKKPDVIEIEGDLGAKVLRIKAVGDVAWAVIIGAVIVAAAAIWMTGPPAVIGATPAAAAIGVGATISVAGLVQYGGTTAVEILRSDYDADEVGHRVVLRRRR